jgi:transcriptional regulator with XRE-family HTH domain
MIIGDRLREMREAKKLSQGDLEKHAGLFRCYISRVENGHTVPAIETIEKFARALEVPIVGASATCALSKKPPELQAADYPAYLGYLHAQERMADRSFAAAPPEPRLNAILQRVKDKRTDLTYVDRENIGRMLEKMPVQPK